LLLAAKPGVPLLQPVNVCSNESLARLDAVMIVINLTRARQRGFVHSIVW
jgi:hypothetical protein